MTPAQVGVWTILVVIAGSLLAIAVVGVVLARRFRSHAADVRAFMKAAAEQARMATDKAVRTEKKVDELTQKIDHQPPPTGAGAYIGGEAFTLCEGP